MKTKLTNPRSATHLINFVKRHDDVARLIGDGRRVQVVCPELDMSNEFIKVIVERYKSNLLLHDGGYTLNGLKNISPTDQDELGRVNINLVILYLNNAIMCA
jgi:DNA-binding NarL/FixJ family response regulator